jgi:ribulose-phosphate 3-epimerase
MNAHKQPNAPRAIRLGGALFNADHGRLAEEIRRLEASGLDFVHIDVYDGHFVSDLGFPPRTVEALRPLTTLPFEVHLGARDPVRFVPALAQAGADAVICHIECMSMAYEDIFKIRACGVKVGLAFSLGTSLETLKPVAAFVDAVLLLSRVTGEGSFGASFDPSVLARVSAVREIAARAAKTLDIQVAGGVKREHIPGLVQAGVTSLALGGGIYRTQDMAREVIEIRSVASSGG